MNKSAEEQEAQVIHVKEDDRGITEFVLNLSRGEKIVLVLDDVSSDISN